MKLTLHTDYSLRVLLYLAHSGDRAVGTQEIAASYGISRHHLVRVVQTLAEAGFVNVKAGRSGGVMLARPAAEIRIGEVVRRTEPSFTVVECFDQEHNTCPIVPMCHLRIVLQDALKAFLAELDQYTLADLATPRRRKKFFQLLGA